LFKLEIVPRFSGFSIIFKNLAWSDPRQLPGNFSAHAAAKSAMDGMAKVMAMELGPSGITVNVVGPGLTITDATAGQPKEVHEQVAAITPLRRLGMPDDIGVSSYF
jgi:3-oxoacyl-[acyl-carrier protein] reductase